MFKQNTFKPAFDTRHTIILQYFQVKHARIQVINIYLSRTYYTTRLNSIERTIPVIFKCIAQIQEINK